MAFHLGWIDFSKEERDKALDILRLLQDPGAVDELGIGIVRDAFADAFFPGTSTLLTRAKYFVVVPYIIQEKIDANPDFDTDSIDVVVEILNPKNYDVVHNYSVNNCLLIALQRPDASLVAGYEYR